MIQKKLNSDVLHLALILAIVRLGPELLRNHWQEPFEVGDGSTITYRRFHSHDVNWRNNRYIALKNLDPFILDEITSVRYRSFSIGGNSAFRDNVIAYYSDPPSAHIFTQEHNEERNNDTTSSVDDRPINTAASSHLDDEERLTQSLENSFNASTLELTPEDMDLIEILWKQDIDLGVSREAYNSHETHEHEKLKTEQELSEKGDPEDKHYEKNEPFEGERSSSLFNDTEVINYIVDSETGEHVMLEPESDEPVFSRPVEQSLLSFDEFDDDDFTTSLFSFDDGFDKTNFNREFLPGDDFLNDLDLDIDDFAVQMEKLERLMESESFDSHLPLESEMYPSMEEYWQDISTTLPLSVMNQPCLPHRPDRDYSEVSSDHSGASASSDVVSSLGTANSPFAGTLQNASLIQRDPEVNSSFTYLSHSLGPTSIGCAVASSIATLTNDTDPMPDVTSAITGTFGLDLPNLLPTNQTIQPSNNENLLSELLLDEDLQLMDVAPAHLTNLQGSSRSFTLIKMFDQEADSKDSASNHNYSTGKDTKLEELTSSACNGKEIVYENFKYTTNASPNCGFNHMESSFNTNYDIGMQLPMFRPDYNCVQHNHSYPLPLPSGNNLPKPVKRDKGKAEKCNDTMSNRDEKKAKALDLPMTISEIINLTIEEFNERLTKFELTEPQHTLIRDIRRRGKNKVAAQNCRKRKLDQICGLQHDLELLQDERIQLEADSAQLLHLRRSVRDKYSKLCQLMLQSSNANPPMLSDFSSDHQSTSSASSTSINPNLCESENDLSYNQGVRAKRKMTKKN